MRIAPLCKLNGDRRSTRLPTHGETSCRATWYDWNGGSLSAPRVALSLGHDSIVTHGVFTANTTF
jgi:hypothetical protein